MISYNIVHIGSFLLIFIAGGLTSVTDLAYKKIRNSHLIAVAVAGIVIFFIEWLTNKSLPILRFSSGVCAIIIALVLYKRNLWRGGDAKLFVLFSFLMHATGYESKIFLPSIALFINSFIIGLFFLGGLFLKRVFAHPSLVAENILKEIREYRFPRAIVATSCFAWVMFPLFQICGLKQYGIIFLLSIYLIKNYLGQQIRIMLASKKLLIAIFIIGWLLHYVFLPNFFSWKNVLSYFGAIIIYPTIVFILSACEKSIVEFDERVPFSPFLFLGCLLSYTPFLWWGMSLQQIGR